MTDRVWYAFSPVHKRNGLRTGYGPADLTNNDESNEIKTNCVFSNGTVATWCHRPAQQSAIRPCARKNAQFRGHAVDAGLDGNAGDRQAELFHWHVLRPEHHQ